MALWQYFIGKFYGYFAEGHVYCASGWFLASLPLVVITERKWRDICSSLFIILVLIYLPFIFTKSYIIQLYIDAPLGILTAYILVFSFYYRTNRIDIFYYVYLAAAVSVLCLMKASGAFLAIVILCTLTAANYWTCNSTQKMCSYISFYTFLSAALGIIIGKYTWTSYLKRTNTEKAWNTSMLTVTNLINFLSGDGKAYQYDTLQNFVRALFHQDFMSYIVKMTYINWLVVFFVCTAFLIKSIQSEYRAKLKVYIVGIYSGLIGYTIGLLVLYLFTYSPYEATRLASFVRYIATYFTTIVLFGLSIWVINNLEKRHIMIPVLFMIIAFFVHIDNLAELTYHYEKSVTATQKLRATYSGILPYVKLLNYKKDKIYIISQNNTGVDYWHIRYILTPIKTAPMVQWYGWSLGKPYYKGDIWTADCTVEEWIDTMQKGACKYVYLHRIDNRFILDFHKAFLDKTSIKSHMLYKLVNIGNMTYRLIPVKLSIN